MALVALDREIAALMPATSPAGRDPLSFLDAWRARRDEALGLIAALGEAKDAARRLDRDAAGVRDGLSGQPADGRTSPGPDETLETLMEAAEAAIDRETKAEALRQKVRERRAEVGRAEIRLKAAEQDNDALALRMGRGLRGNRGSPGRRRRRCSAKCGRRSRRSKSCAGR